MKKRFSPTLLSPLILICFLGAPALFGATISIHPIADAYTATGATGGLSNNNYGGGGALAIAAPELPNGEFQSVIKFDLASVRSSLDAMYGAGSWFVESVTLQLSSSPHSNVIYNEIAPGSFGISLMQNNSWVEGSGNASSPGITGITYNSLQTTFINAATDQPLGTFSFAGGSSGFNGYDLTLSSGLSGDILAGNQLTLRLSAADSEVSYLFSSRAASPVENQPQLIVISVPEPRSIVLLSLGLAWVLTCRRRPQRGYKLHGTAR